ncbi:glycosyltransferase family 4 protein [Deinococcus taeanensis]|uniref:glycosyltransferase family 4 protein n=1 Tax=Deinococcus taeanensis TaxID=2737050 RepID=UPI001CDBCB94|nr:glycosyltransferase family 4 protein [Deinococcus taeanensis]UBV42728.1 glycosyltransferase family 4 protein [Deinococcus taeanensis]
MALVSALAVVLKVLILSQYFWPESFRINDVAQGLQEQGHQVEVLTGFPNYPFGQFFAGYEARRPARDVLGKVRIHRVPLLARRNGKGLRLLLNYLSFAVSAAMFGPFLVRRPDVILVFEPSPVTVGFPAAVLRRVFQVPVAFWVQDLWPESLVATGSLRNRRALALVSRIVRWIYRHCDLLLVQSRAFSRSLVKHGVSLSKIEYLPNSAEAFYRPVAIPADAPERQLVPQDGIVNLMFAGNLGVSQDLETLVDAAAQLRHEPVRWLILGDGRQRPWLEEEIRRRELQSCIHLLGSYPAETMPRFFALADILLVSLKDDPAFRATIPSKLQSYLACGRPVLAALNGEGARVTLDAGAGLTVAAERPDELARAVLEFIRLSPTQREEMGERGRRYFLRNFERGYLLHQLIELLGSVATRGITKEPKA